jgi:hypothetical protein
MRERRLARDPLADLIPAEPTGDTQPPASPTSNQRSSVTAHSAPRPATGRDRITDQVERDLAEQGRGAVMWLHRVGVHTTISAIAGDGLRAELQRLAEVYNEGRRFPPRQGDVPVGRPPRC